MIRRNAACDLGLLLWSGKEASNLYNNFISIDGDCNVVPMTEWAGEPSHHQDILQEPVKIVIIQHTVTPEGNSDDECIKRIKGIRKYHIETMHFDDIGES